MPAGAGGAGDTSPGNVLGGFGSGLNFNWQGVFGLNLPNYITISDLGLPVGLGGIPFLEPWLGLPPPDAEIVTLEKQDSEEKGTKFLSDEIDRRDAAPNESDLPVAVGWGGPQTVSIAAAAPLETLSDEEWFKLMFPGTVWVPPVTSTTVVPTAAPTTPQTPEAAIVSTEDNVSWIEDIYTTIDTGLGGWLPGGAPLGSSIPSAGFGVPTTAPTTMPVVVTPQPGSPPAMVNPAIKQYCYKLVDGQWKLVKMRRRRRKQLATKSDLQDLAALKGILGLGKAFEVWIATHA